MWIYCLEKQTEGGFQSASPGFLLPWSTLGKWHSRMEDVLRKFSLQKRLVDRFSLKVHGHY